MSENADVLREIRGISDTLATIDKRGALQDQALENLGTRFEEHRGTTDKRLERLNEKVDQNEKRLRSVELSRAQLVGIYFGVSGLAALIGSLAAFAVGSIGG